MKIDWQRRQGLIFLPASNPTCFISNQRLYIFYFVSTHLTPYLLLFYYYILDSRLSWEFTKDGLSNLKVPSKRLDNKINTNKNYKKKLKGDKKKFYCPVAFHLPQFIPGTANKRRMTSFFILIFIFIVSIFFRYSVLYHPHRALTRANSLQFVFFITLFYCTFITYICIFFIG